MDEATTSKTRLLSRPGGKIFLIWVVLTIAGIAFGLYLPGPIMPHMLSTEGHTAVLTVVLFTVLAAPVAALVYAVAFYSLIKWRYRGDQNEPPPDGPPMRGNSGLTILWLTLSSLLVIVLLVWGMAEYTAAQTTHPDTLKIDVTGQQWLWSFTYPGTNIETHDLVLPVNRTIEFDITSEDVTHGFWTPALGVQVDANPGVETVLQTTTNHLGSFVVRCSQICGLYHSFMYAQGEVVSPSTFASWLQSEGASSTAADSVANA